MTALPEFYVKHDKNHRWDICGFCGLMVLCGTCGNNCCNGGHGEVDGKPCPDCASAYLFQEEYNDEAHTFYDFDIKKWRSDQAKRDNDLGPETIADLDPLPGI